MSDKQITAILSIDGGGVRGIIPSIILQEFESTGPGISDLFDVVAGTSTGGILALGLTLQAKGGVAKYRASDMVKLYKTQAQTIFPTPKFNALNPLGRMQDALSKPKYDGEGLKSVLKEYFGNAMLEDCRVETLITAYDTVTRLPHIFTRSAASKNPDHNFLVRDVARATSAAPTFFPPVKLEVEDDKETLTLIDGGVCANNPSLLAYRHAVQLYPDTTILLISIGTGKYKRPLHYKSMKEWGPLRWVGPLIDVMFDGTDEVTHASAKCLFESLNRGVKPKLGKGHYYVRLQIELPSENDYIDASNPDAIAELESITKRYCSKNSEIIEQLRNFLLAAPPATTEPPKAQWANESSRTTRSRPGKK